MNLLAAVLLLCALPLFVAVAVRLTTTFKRVMALVCVLAFLCAIAFGVDKLSRPITGILTGKTENLELATRGLQPGVAHRLVLTVAVQGTDSSQFEVEERVYDAARRGQQMPLHRLRWGPLTFARLDAEPWWNLAPGRLERWLAPLHSGARVLTRAQVVSLRTVRDAYVYSWASILGEGTAHILLEQPYDEVKLRFLNPPGADIVALDRVDEGSAGALTPGTFASVTYPSERPRTARLVAGTRDFAAHNAKSYWLAQILVAGAILILIGLAEAARRRISGRLDSLRQARARSRPRASDHTSLRKDGKQ